MGAMAAGKLLELANAAEAAPPMHIPFDPWGRRIDRLEVSAAWRELEAISARAGLIATGYERKHGEYSRLHQFSLLYLFHASSAFFTCPLAMTDGAARALELYGDDALKRGPLQHLLSRDPARFWTSGQWMTEREGGSDVGKSSTVARQEGGEWRLYGDKWFTSATTGQMAMALARIEGHPEGSKGLSLFYLELRDKEGKLQNIEVRRLKDKLGTKAVPTAELTLKGTPALLVGGEGGGVRKIAALFNITRLFNSICALSAMRRALVLATDYAHKRSAFGKLLAQHPLHRESLAELRVDFASCFQLTFHLIGLLGKEETGTASAEEAAVLRLLTPVAKLYTAKISLKIVSEMLESFGGAGYVEDTGLPRQLRDAQVFSIWEGTTNVLSLDVLRAVEKEQAFPAFASDLQARLAKVRDPLWSESVQQTQKALAAVTQTALAAQKEGAEFAQAGARDFAFALARLYSAALMLEFAAATGDAAAAVAARRICASLGEPLRADAAHRRDSETLFNSDEL